MEYSVELNAPCEVVFDVVHDGTEEERPVFLRRLRGEHSAHGLVRSAGNAEPRDLQAANPRAASAAPLPYRAILSTVASLNLFLNRLVAFDFAVADVDDAVGVHARCRARG